MKFFCISDNTDTQTGMRLAGIEGTVVHTEAEVMEAIDRARQDPQIGIVLVSDKLVRLCYEQIYHLKLTLKSPLIVEIPDRHGTSDIGANISRYVREAIGIKL